MLDQLEVVALMGPETAIASPDSAIAALARVQHGVVARRQLLALGLGSGAVRHRIAAGRLHRLHPGVYAVGHRAVTIRGRWMAAVLAAGPGAVLSHRSAAALWGLRRPGGPIEVTVPRCRPRRAGFVTRATRLPADEVDVRDGIAVTTVARTLFDLAAVVDPQAVERAFHEAEYRRLPDQVGLPALLERHPGRPGAPVLRATMARRGRRRTRTRMEADFLAFLDEHGLPRPETNVCRAVGGRWIEADAVFAGPRLIVELDGGSHLTVERFHSDRERDRTNLVGGWRTIRVTSRHLDEGRDELLADLVVLLRRRPR